MLVFETARGSLEDRGKSLDRMARSLKTGDLVLCKVGSFPPWPAVVFPQRLLRNDVYRKRKQNCVAVCFFNDPTYYWEQPHRLNRLESDEMDEFLSLNSSVTAQPELIEAYQQAKDFKSLHEFVVSRFTEEGRKDDLEREISEGEIKHGEDPSLGKTKIDLARRKIHKDKTVPIASSKATAKRKIPSNESSKSKIVKTDHPESKSMDEDINKKSDSKSSLKHSSSHSVDRKMNEKRTKLDRARRVEISLLFRRRIQKNLVQRDQPPSEYELEESHKMLNKIKHNLDNDPPFFDLEALRQSKLHKLFKVIVNDSNLEEFHPVCEAALIRWKELIIKLKSEKPNGNLGTR